LDFPSQPIFFLPGPVPEIFDFISWSLTLLPVNAPSSLATPRCESRSPRFGVIPISIITSFCVRYFAKGRCQQADQYQDHDAEMISPSSSSLEEQIIPSKPRLYSLAFFIFKAAVWNNSTYKRTKRSA
jgi:hypothetical protein